MAKRAKPLSPYEEAELRLASFLHRRSFREREIERNPKYRALREQIYQLAIEIALAREAKVLAAASLAGLPCPLIIWEQNRPNGVRRPKRCSNCNLIVRRAKSGRCRRCAQVWAVSSGMRERPIPLSERAANAMWRTLRQRSLKVSAPRKAPVWTDPTLRFSEPDERVKAAVVAAPRLGGNGKAPLHTNGNGHRASNGNGNGPANGNGNGHHAPFGDPDWRRHLTNLLTTTPELSERT